MGNCTSSENSSNGEQKKSSSSSSSKNNNQHRHEPTTASSTFDNNNSTTNEEQAHSLNPNQRSASLESFKKSAELSNVFFNAAANDDDDEDSNNTPSTRTRDGGDDSYNNNHHSHNKNKKIVSLSNLENLHSAQLSARLQEMSRGRIAVFDSGVGGLSVVKQLAHQLPYEAIVYFGDSGRSPYGDRSPAEVRKFSQQIVEFLVDKHDVKCCIIACNTATVAALDALQRKLDIPVVGMIAPGSLAVACVAGNQERVGVVATSGTINSKGYELGIAKLRWDLDVVTQATPQLAPLIENTDEYGEEELKIIRESVEPIQEAKCPTVILGCTHYPIIADHIQKILGPEVRLIDPAIAVVMKLKQLLSNSGLLRNSPAQEQFGNDRYIFYTSGEPDGFKAVFAKWMKDIRSHDRMQVLSHDWQSWLEEQKAKKNRLLLENSSSSTNNNNNNTLVVEENNNSSKNNSRKSITPTMKRTSTNTIVEDDE